MGLRELMTDGIKGCAWLDYEYLHETGKSRQSSDKDSVYVKYLNSLSDEDFLATYNRVQQAERELD
jgi:hypothetical protein